MTGRAGAETDPAIEVELFALRGRRMRRFPLEFPPYSTTALSALSFRPPSRNPAGGVALLPLHFIPPVLRTSPAPDLPALIKGGTCKS